MKHLLTSLRALAAGAAAMYLFDPNHGRRRRALIREKLLAAGRDARELAAGKVRRASDRGRGLLADARARLHPEAASDDTLLARVRAALGRAVPRARHVDTAVVGGELTVRGAVTRTEASRLRAALRDVRGLTAIHDRLDVREDGARRRKPPPRRSGATPGVPR